MDVGIKRAPLFGPNRILALKHLQVGPSGDVAGQNFNLEKGGVEILVTARIMVGWKPPVQIASGVFFWRAARLRQPSFWFTGFRLKSCSRTLNAAFLLKDCCAMLIGSAKFESEFHGSLFVFNGLFVRLSALHAEFRS